VPDKVLSFVRANDDSKVFAVINFSPQTQTVHFSGSLHHGAYQDYFAAVNMQLDGDLALELGPWEYRVFID
jgi:hypothetical protein